MAGIKDVLTKAKAAKEVRKGDDMGKKGKGFDKLADKAGKEYGSKKAGTISFNGQSGGRHFGAIPKSSIVIREYKA